ncbi:hypothetical protein LCGC14_0351490 [marine sediment metagenome]|uniref:Uncharacterized protein n=1 Tax=marine sediment metagenome TaxID=412755 RepID=A0A0F9TAS0_9ZZZZ
MKDRKGICFKCGMVMKLDVTDSSIGNKSALTICTVCKKPNVASVAMKRYNTVKEQDTVTHVIKLDSEKEKKLRVFKDEQVILLLMEATQERELLSAGFVEAFEFIRSGLIGKPTIRLEEL